MPDQAVTPRRIAGRYLLGDELGRGGIGIVWRATDELLRRQVAVKEISFPKTVSEDDAEALRTRVLREARAAAGVNHPGVVSVYDILQSEERAFIVMELVQAPTLADLVRDEGALSPTRAATVGIDVLESLRIAHNAGIVHRDVKPANVMVPHDGRAKLADFGIASLQNDPRLTASGIILGSPAFMAPEQAQENSSSPATDLWGLGATLFFAVHGEPPFDKGQAIPTLTAVLSDEPRITEKAGALGPVIGALLEKDPRERPTAEEVHAMLETVGGGGAPGASTATAVVPVPQPTQTETVAAPARTAPAPARRETFGESVPNETRGRGLLIGLGVAALAGLIAVLFFTGGEDEQEPNDGGQRNRNAAAQKEDGEDEDAPADGEKVDPVDEDQSGDELPLESFTDPTTGYVVEVPEGWTETPQGATTTDFRSPSGAYLRVAYRTPPGEDVLGTLRGIYDRFATDKANYNEIALEPVEYRDYDAAQAEYTYSDGDVTLHAINLQFVTGDYGFALNLQAPEDEWAELLPTFEAIKESFQPPS